MTRHRMYLLASLLLLASVLVAAGVSIPRLARAHGEGFYQQTNLVSDIPGKAKFTDPNLVNAWGLSRSPVGPWRVSDNGKGVSTAYQGNGRSVPPVIIIPPPTGSPAGTLAAPTGNVFNGTDDFVVKENHKSGPSLFIFATEDGTISGWNPNVDKTNAILAVDNSKLDLGAVYKGLAIGSNEHGDFLYAADFRNGRVDVFDRHFNRVHLKGSFTDSNLSPCSTDPTIACFAPFGIQNINGKIYVTYALQKLPDKHDDQAGPHNGFVDVFDTEGHLLRRFAAHGALNSPWGLALAPRNFGQFSNDVLVGNFGDGLINAFDSQTGTFRGPLADQKGNPITINGLWGIAFGNGRDAGERDELFFASGLNDEANGLFGKIQFIREN